MRLQNNNPQVNRWHSGGFILGNVECEMDRLSQQYWRRCARLPWWRGSWAGWQSLRFTSRSMFQLSPMVMTCGKWPKEWDHRYRRPKLVSLVQWLGSALEIQGEELRHPQGAPSCHKEPAEVLRWFWLGCCWRLPSDVFGAWPTGRRPWGRPRDYVSSGLGTPWDHSGEAGTCCWGEGHLEYPA